MSSLPVMIGVGKDVRLVIIALGFARLEVLIRELSHIFKGSVA